MTNISLEKPKTTELDPTLCACADRIRTAHDRLKVAFADYLNVVSGELRKAQKLLAKQGSHDSTFSQWCLDEFGWNRAYVHRVMNANLKLEAIMSPIGDMKPSQLPTNEAQLRELAAVPDDEVAEVWNEAVETAEQQGKPVTAKVVRETVKKRATRTAAPAEEAEQPTYDMDTFDTSIARIRSVIDEEASKCPEDPEWKRKRLSWQWCFKNRLYSHCDSLFEPDE